jgi:hypothetical protein
MLIISDGHDWTSNTPEIEFPYLQRIYDQYGVKHSIKQVHFPMEHHDYGLSKRSAVYVFLAKELQLDLDVIPFKQETGRYDESFVTLLDEEQLNVFDDTHKPKNLLKGDQAVTTYLEKEYQNH